MINWGPDASGVWSQGPVGLGHLMLYNTPESPHESLPLKNQAGDIIQRVRTSQNETEAVLQKLEESTLAQQYLDLSRTRDTLEALQHTIDPDLTDRVRFNFLRELMIGLFLQRFEDH